MRERWNRLLIKLHLRSELAYAVPAFPATPHAYDNEITNFEHGAKRQLKCCAQCGGGAKHPIHQSGVKVSPASAEDRRETFLGQSIQAAVKIDQEEMRRKAFELYKQRYPGL